mgnify:CR=1 FL=1
MPVTTNAISTPVTRASNVIYDYGYFDCYKPSLYVDTSSLKLDGLDINDWLLNQLKKPEYRKKVLRLLRDVEIE